MKTLARLFTVFASSTLCASAIAAPYSAEVLTDSPISYQQFNEISTASSAYDSTGNGHNGTYKGGVTPGVATGYAMLGSSSNYNGVDGRVQIPSSAAYQLGNGDFSIEAWINTGATGRGDYFTYKGGTTDFGMHYTSTGTQTTSAYHDGFVATSPNNSISLNSWHHIVYTRTGCVGQLYLNGSPSASGTDNQQFSNAATDLLIGSNHSGDPNNSAIPFNGKIDEFAIYGSALSASRVSAHYQAGIQQTQSVGVNFVGGGGPGSGASLLSSDSAGVVPQTNWNNQTGSSGGPIVLNDNTGAVTGMLMTFSAGGTYTTTANTPVGGDEKLNQGFIFGSSSVAVSNVPYGVYDVIAYTLNDAVRDQTTSLTTGSGTSTFYGSSPDPNGFVDGNGGTAYNYVRAVSTTGGTFTAGANYVWFRNVTGSSFTLNTSAPGNGYLNGFQIVQVPEPSSFALAALGLAGVFGMGRRRKL